MRRDTALRALAACPVTGSMAGPASPCLAAAARAALTREAGAAGSGVPWRIAARAVATRARVSAALAAAARHGLAGPAAGPVTGIAADPRRAVSRLIDHVYPALSDHGDAQTITRLLRRLDQQGTGADRQRALFASAASPAAFARALARATLSHSM